MHQVSSQELDRRIDTFLSRKHEEFPELKLRSQKSDKKAPVISEVLADLMAGFRWEFGR